LIPWTKGTALKKLVEEPTHICTKCGRVSNAKQRLCKPDRFD